MSEEAIELTDVTGATELSGDSAPPIVRGMRCCPEDVYQGSMNLMLDEHDGGFRCTICGSMWAPMLFKLDAEERRTFAFLVRIHGIRSTIIGDILRISRHRVLRRFSKFGFKKDG